MEHSKMGESILYKIYFSKLALCLCTLAVIVGFYALPVKAQTVGPESFGVDITTEDGAYTYTVKWWRQEFPDGNEYYITIPYSEQKQSMKVNFVSDSDVYLNGEKLENGQELLNLEKYNKFLCGEKEYRLHVMHGSNIPTMHITTESGDIGNIYKDREYKESAYARIIENGIVAYEGELEYIKGRGNYSWSFLKKPFNIKFKEKKIYLKWAQLKNGVCWRILMLFGQIWN